MIVVLIVAAMPVAIAVGMVRGRVLAVAALERLVGELSEPSNLAGLQQALSQAFADPTVQLLEWDIPRARYLGVDGEPVDLAALHGGRTVTYVSRGDTRAAAIVHEPGLSDDVFAAAGSAVLLALANAQLQDELSSSIRELESSRQRIGRVADDERRRIEHDLHDGAQQGLVALRIRLHMLEERAQEPRSMERGLADAGRRVDAALQQIRDLAKGIYPSVLHDLGLAAALSAAVRDLSIAGSVRSELHGACPRGRSRRLFLLS